MRPRPSLAAGALLAAGVLLGWVAACGCLAPIAPAQDKSDGKTPGIPDRFDELANLRFMENRPTKETAQTLRDELLFQRATQTYLWALPLINTLGMKVGSEEAFGTFCPSGKNDSTPKPS